MTVETTFMANIHTYKSGFPFSAKCHTFDYFMQFDWLLKKEIDHQVEINPTFLSIEHIAQSKGITNYELSTFCTEWEIHLNVDSIYHNH